MSTPPSNQGRKFVPEPLTPDEVRTLISAVSNRSSSGIRLRAMVGTLYGSGLRLAEMLSLYPRDVDTEACTVRVRNGKGGKTRTVGFDPYGCALLDRWLDRRASLGLNGRHPIFATFETGSRVEQSVVEVGRPLQPRYVRNALAQLGVKAGLEKRVAPHQLRHSLAFDMAMNGTPTHVIQAQLGHGSLAVTDRYVRHLMPADVINVMRGRDWS